MPTTTDDIACVEQRQPWLIGLNKNRAQKTIDATNYGNVIYHAAGNTQPEPQYSNIGIAQVSSQTGLESESS